MAKTGQNFEIVAGDTVKINISVTDQNNAAVDLTNATVTWLLYKNLNDTAVSKSTTTGITITNVRGGVFQISLTAADTQNLAGMYTHAAKVTDALGNAITVTTGTATIDAAHK